MVFKEKGAQFGEETNELGFDKTVEQGLQLFNGGR